MFKIKHGVDGEFECYKAKLVAGGFTQTFGNNLQRNLSLVVKFVSIRCMLALTTIERHRNSSNGHQNRISQW
jgi:hypothetical protein